MKTISIANQDSRILVGESRHNVSNYLPKDKQIIVITDEEVYKHYADFIDLYPHLIVGCGEEIKTWDTISFLINRLLELGADRSSFLLGVGGGVVTDMTGFVASIFMRGIEFGFVASTLLAQVDASMGGKNGINFQKYKNMIGVFNPPKFVICDTEMLKTLPKEELNSGFGEVLKHAFIKDIQLYEYLRSQATLLKKLSPKELEQMLYEAIMIKVRVVEEDPFEHGERKKLNFGHTLGHAIENNSSFKHGEAIAIGMVWAAKLSLLEGKLSTEDYERLRDLLKLYDLPLEAQIPLETLKSFYRKDKKKEKEAVNFVLLEKIGQATVKKFTFRELDQHLEKLTQTASQD